jgi:hypothetical protein
MDTNYFEVENYQSSESKKVEIRRLIEFISCKLYCHEKINDKVNSRTHYRIPSLDNIVTKQIGNNKYHYYFTNIFYALIAENILIDAAEKHPNFFGTGNSADIIKALNLIKPGFCPDDSIYKEEQFCYVVEENEFGELNESNILKIQLFRFQELQTNTASCKEFTGGLFHAFKHFTFNGINLSLEENPKHNLDYHPSFFIFDLTNAFFNTKLLSTKDKKYKSGLLGRFNDIDFYFFYDNYADLGVYFLTTAYRNKKG